MSTKAKTEGLEEEPPGAPEPGEHRIGLLNCHAKVMEAAFERDLKFAAEAMADVAPSLDPDAVIH